MRTEFKRAMNRNYMLLHPEEDFGESYTLRMLSENRIPGLLPFQEKRIDGKISLYFDITSRQSLSRMMEYRPFAAKEIRQITGDLIATMTSLERFLVDGDQLCLEPDMIYVDPDDLKADFCLLPGTGAQFEVSFRKLARYILDHVDHTDGDAVILAFALFKAGEKENLGIRDLELCLRAGERDPEKKNKKESVFRKPGAQTNGESHAATDKTDNVPKKYMEKKWDDPPGYSEKQKRTLQNQDYSRSIPAKTGTVPALPEEEETGNQKYAPVKEKVVFILLAVLMPLIPAALFLFGGIDLLFDWKWGILAAEGVLAAGIFLTGTGGNKDQKDEEDEGEDWEVVFREEERKEEGGSKEGEGFFEERQNLEETYISRGKTTYEKESEPDEIQTVLLTGRQIYPTARRLVPENGGEEISVGYFPFIIGKSREIADLCLNLPQISRIHAKIEENGEGYLITDLNSTNGTSVNGRFLETNESVSLKPGEMVSFADQSYRFL